MNNVKRLFGIFLMIVGFVLPGCSSASGELPTESEPLSIAEESETHINTINDKWLPLLEENSEFAGWISVPNTTIDYPVMQTSDNDKYLHTDFYSNYSVTGTPFIDYRCSIEPRSQNLIIYGHRTSGNGMFGQFEKYTDQEYAELYPTFQFSTLYSDDTYTIFAVMKLPTMGTDVFDYTVCDFETDEDSHNFIAEAKSRSLVCLKADITASDLILTIQTCSYGYEGERLVVMAYTTGTKGTSYE